MSSSKIISNSIVPNYLVGNTKVNQVEALFKEQIDSWALAKENYKKLNLIKKREFDFDNFKIILQYNSGRIISSSAKVDSQSIKERPCFLCVENLPNEQKGLLCNEKYILLINPFPIFNKHFTITQIEHKPQEILPNFSDMLVITREIGENYSLFYNGPKCGASAPDHMHFQASPKNRMPVEQEISTLLANSQVIMRNNFISVYAISNYLRNFFLLESDHLDSVVEGFTKLYVSIGNMGDESEPLMNIIVTFDEVWRVFVFPRKAHRPKEYFLNGENKIVISPAAVDFGGLVITPREEDFYKVTEKEIQSVFRQTSLDDNSFNECIERYRKNI